MATIKITCSCGACFEVEGSAIDCSIESRKFLDAHEKCRLVENQIIDIAQLHVGDKVRYQPSHYENEKWENGIVKEIRDNVTDSVWVVYNCAGNWDRYMDYTSAKTNLQDLKLGWKH